MIFYGLQKKKKVKFENNPASEQLEWLTGDISLLQKFIKRVSQPFLDSRIVGLMLRFEIYSDPKKKNLNFVF